jgi:hypothetical protein
MMKALVRRLGEFFAFAASKEAATLSALFRRKNGKPAAKWQGYLQHYDRHFSSIKGKQVRLLEIGVQAGGSLEVWAHYFKSAKHIIGCDIDPACENLRYTDPRINIVLGNINSSETLESIAAITDTLDVIIDDGSHNSSDIIKSFVQLFPRLADGGIYLIEDLHCSYWESYDGGLYAPFSAVSFFKKIVDLVNYQVWGISVEIKEFMSEFIAIIGGDDREIAQLDIDWRFIADIHSIEFVNSICIVHKRTAEKNVLGPLIISGDEQNENKNNRTINSLSQYVAADISVPNQSNNMFSKSHISNLGDDERILLAYQELSRLRKENTLLTTQFYESTKKYFDASVTIQQLEYQINQIKLANSVEFKDKNS